MANGGTLEITLEPRLHPAALRFATAAARCNPQSRRASNHCGAFKRRGFYPCRHSAQPQARERDGRIVRGTGADSGFDLFYGSDATPKTLVLAAALRETLMPGQAGVFDLLRWDEVISPAHLVGGTRDPQELYSLLRLRARDLPRLPPIVPIDDVLASGGHLRAAAAFVTDCGAQVQMAICAGRAETTPGPLERPFASRTDVLADFVADPDWLLPYTTGYA